MRVQLRRGGLGLQTHLKNRSVTRFGVKTMTIQQLKMNVINTLVGQTRASLNIKNLVPEQF